MATKQTGIQLKVSAVNATGRVFKNIAASAASVTASIAKWGAVAAGAAFGGFVAITKKLGALSDVAQAAGMTTEEITKLSAALDILGIKGSKPEELAAAFQRMTKATGQVGLEGFHRVVEEISKLPTVQDRATAAMQVFGRTGLQFMPLIEGAAKNGVGALKEVEAAMPGISNAAADACDDVSDAMSIMWNGIKSGFAEGIADISGLIDSDLNGGMRQAAAIGAAQMKYFVRVGFRYIGTFAKNFRQVFSDTFDWLGKAMNNALIALGGFITTAVENMVTRVTGMLDDIGTAIGALMAKLGGDKESEKRYLQMIMRSRAAREQETQKNWDEYSRLMQGLDWNYTGIMADIDTSDLAAQRDADVANAKKLGEAYGKAAVKVSADALAKINAGNNIGGKRADTTNPEAIMGGSYKAITYAMRQGYASGIAEIKNLVKKAVEGLKGVKDAVENNHMDLAAQ